MVIIVNLSCLIHLAIIAISAVWFAMPSWRAPGTDHISVLFVMIHSLAWLHAMIFSMFGSDGIYGGAYSAYVAIWLLSSIGAVMLGQLFLGLFILGFGAISLVLLKIHKARHSQVE